MTSVFLDKIEIELLDSNLQDVENCFNFVKNIIKNDVDDIEIHNTIRNRINLDDQEKISKGLVYGILAGYDWTKYLLSGNQDLLNSVCITFASLVPSLKSRCIGLSLFTKVWKIGCVGFNDLFLTFLRTFDIFYEIRNELDWVCNSSFLSLIFYKIVRQTSLCLSEGSGNLSDYTQLISTLWRSKRDACLSIGRDLMRIISPLSEVSGLELIWNDLFSPSRDGSPLYWSLLCTPTHPKYHSVLLTPSLEARIVYVIENANASNYTRYLKWITEDYGENIVPDVVRFITTFPSSVESTPRWRIIAWLLTCTPDHQLQANIKQALIFDCLFYNQKDQMYTIEPLMSLLKFSVSRFPQIAEEILEFLLSSAELYDRRSVAGIMRSLKECFNIAYYHRIIPSLDNLISDERIDSTIRSRLSDLFDTSVSGSEPSQSPIYDDDTPPTTPKLFEFIGDIGNDFHIDPCFEKLQQILEKNSITKDLISFILKSISHELAPPLSVELQRNSVHYQVFNTAEQDEKMFDLLNFMLNMESAIGIRLLIFSIHNKSNLYFQFPNYLERDLKTCMDEVSIDTLNWIYLYLLKGGLFTPVVFIQFLAAASSELCYQTELDLKLSKYKIIGLGLEDVLRLSLTIPSSQKIYLWKFIVAEVPVSKLSTLIDFCSKNYCAEYWSGIEEAIMHHLSTYNLVCLSHIKHWHKNKLGLCSAIRSQRIQECLGRCLQGMSIELAEEFNCLLENSRKLYTL